MDIFKVRDALMTSHARNVFKTIVFSCLKLAAIFSVSLFAYIPKRRNQFQTVMVAGHFANVYITFNINFARPTE